MHTYWKAALVAPVVAVAMPVMADVADASYTNWKEEADVYHLYDDVRTVRFTEAVDASTLKNIVVYDETARKVVATRATVGADPREIKISLASGALYEHNHAYTLTIENLKGLKTKKTIRPTNYKFVMEYKQPEEISFATSYLVTNTLDEVQSFTVPAGAVYIEQDKDNAQLPGSWSSVLLKKDEKVNLAPGKKLTVSFLKPTVLKDVDGFKIDVTNKHAFKLFKMYEGNSLRVKGKDRSSQPVVYFGNPEQTVYASYVEYETDGKVVTADYQVESKNGYKYEQLFRENEIIITNEDSNYVYVYALNATA